MNSKLLHTRGIHTHIHTHTLKGKVVTFRNSRVVGAAAEGVEPQTLSQCW